MAFTMEEGDRESYFENARRSAQQDWEKDPSNVQALVRWGGALLELAHYRQGDESVGLIDQAIGKLRVALDMDASRADAEWCLGNAYTSKGFLCPTKSSANEQFRKAETCFKSCQQKDPANEMYTKAVEMCLKAPVYYDEIQEQLRGAMGGGEEGPRESGSSDSDFWWDIAGWALLAGVIVGGLTFARTAAASSAK